MSQGQFQTWVWQLLAPPYLILGLEEEFSAAWQFEAEHVRSFGVVSGDVAWRALQLDGLLMVEVVTRILKGTERLI